MTKKLLKLSIGDYVEAKNPSLYRTHFAGTARKVLDILHGDKSYGMNDEHRSVIIDCAIGPTCDCRQEGKWSLFENEFMVVDVQPEISEEELSRAVTFPDIHELEKFVNR